MFLPGMKKGTLKLLKKTNDVEKLLVRNYDGFSHCLLTSCPVPVSKIH